MNKVATTLETDAHESTFVDLLEKRLRDPAYSPLEIGQFMLEHKEDILQWLQAMRRPN